jgi:hypothetical protein
VEHKSAELENELQAFAATALPIDLAVKGAICPS